jgi:polysaccharide export outer membrane protein
MMLLMACAASLAGCAGSSSSSAAMGAGGYTASGTYSDNGASSPGGPGFAPTDAATHSAAASQAADKLTSVAKPGSSVYEIGPLDVLDVSVFKVPDLTKTVQVDEDGTINFPLVGDIKAAGRTAHQLEQDLTQRLSAKYLRSPQVTVFVKEYNSQRVTVEGSVRNSGVYTIKGRTTLIQVMAMAGGVNIDTASGDIVIFRTVDGTRSAARFDIDAIKSGQANDPELQPGDVVVVDTSATKVALGNILKVLPLATTAAVFSGM